jgi:hypothetical protein
MAGDPGGPQDFTGALRVVRVVGARDRREGAWASGVLHPIGLHLEAFLYVLLRE